MKKIVKGFLVSAVFVSIFVLFFAFGGNVFAQSCGGLPTGRVDYFACTAERSESCSCRDGKFFEKICERFSSCPADRPNMCNGFYYGSCAPIPTPTPNNSIRATGYVKDTFGRGIAGAKVTVNKVDNTYGPCLGTHFGCGTVTTDWSGKWTVSCTMDAKTKSLRIMETQNAAGYKDSTRKPDAGGGSVWDVNTVCKNPVFGGQTVQNVNFYDLKK